MLDCWNKIMAKMFLPSWMNCIDESMSKWVNEYTCPGFMFVPCMPWSLGNEYHDAGCAELDIIWALELWEGKDHPPKLNNKPFDDDIGKTVGTLLCLTEPVWGSGTEERCLHSSLDQEASLFIPNTFPAITSFLTLWKKGLVHQMHFRECLIMSNSMLLQ